MPRINILSPHVADLIAAGEVVERPASAVKELVENAIDAGARNITVEIRGGGAELIRVTDATSKLHDERGLEAIGTLGFRGEALAAISSVSHIELSTCERGAMEGTYMRLDAGDIMEMRPDGAPEGTSISVRGLFYNTPARRKFLKSDRAEGVSCVQAAMRCALGRPDVSIRCIRDGKEEFFTPGDSRAESAIYALLGRDLALGMLPVASAEGLGPVRASGFTGAPTTGRGSRSAQYFFVNGRYIKSQLLQAAVEQAYRGTLLTGKFPACVIYLTLNAAAVDVNVHPTKMEVKFSDERAVFNAVHYAVLGALEEKRAPVEAADSTDSSVQAETLRKGWAARGVTFSDGGCSMISVVFHDRFSETENTLFIGHVGVLLPAGDDGLYFVEKVAFQEPYRLTKFESRAALKSYLMAKYDTGWGQDTTPPFLMENDVLMDGEAAQ